MTFNKENNNIILILFLLFVFTSGIITKLAIQLKPLPSSVQVSLIKLKSFQNMSPFIIQLRKALHEILSAVEFMDLFSLNAVYLDAPQILDKIIKSSSSFTLPFATSTTTTATTNSNNKADRSNNNNNNNSNNAMQEIWVLIETSGSDKDNDKSRLEMFLSDMIEREIVLDAIIAQDQTQFHSLWSLREYVPVALAHVSRKRVTGVSALSGDIRAVTDKFNTTNNNHHHHRNNADSNDYNSNNKTNNNMDMAMEYTGRLYKYDVSLAVSEMTDFIAEIQAYLIRHNLPVANTLSPTTPTPTPCVTDQNDNCKVNNNNNNNNYNNKRDLQQQQQQQQQTDQNRLNIANTNNNLQLNAVQKKVIDKLQPYADIKICCFGHVGDQNLHLNVLLTWSFPSTTTSTSTTTTTTSTTIAAAAAAAVAVESDVESYKDLLKVRL
jgi:FAD/FMN-containing dehydrogenase